jgi:uncharacterized DUF497 family protein
MALLLPTPNSLSPTRTVLSRKILAHSENEKRFYCFGEVEGGIMTVRFIYRDGLIRIFGAGYWRKGKAIYERENKIHQ